jgi:hypothetical protein
LLTYDSLKSLLSLLSELEIQDMHTWTDAIGFYYHVIAELPLEIYKNIAQYLAFQEASAA